MADKIQPWGMMNRWAVQELDGQPAQQFVATMQAICDKLNAISASAGTVPPAATDLNSAIARVNFLVDALMAKGVL
ncbi:hypothetical protein FACS1894186_4900 [Alphaproteobacteria bacterium]|nr:hypothetical protein FACS1894186_4900 [Alphaproteobacteria bacterium]